ncbi:MAG TPA: AmmeMemoRadiSam system radical SAM enzyme [Elusimicrobia bacterium]|jgi:pyruvate formate lyase activating enzyme|nr:AmmeMemoRadiSam system radical SAM enzyme [Elusimicrobiota bacterium]
MNTENKEAILYEKLLKSKVRCNICQRRCLIEESKFGWCGTRINQKGKLYTLIYGKVSSWIVSPIEKKPMFHYYPGSRWFSLGTLGCNFRCPGCQNWEIAHAKPLNIRENAKHAKTQNLCQNAETEFISPEECINLAKKYNCLGISWTYNEPTIWFEYTLDCAKLVKSPRPTRHSLLTNYVTNGFITSEALDTIGPYLDSFRVDIKGFSKKTYQKIAHLSDFIGILKVTKRAKEKWNMHIEIVTNLILTVNDDLSELRDLANWIISELGENTPWHITRFIPYLYWDYLPVTPVKDLEKAREIGLKTGLKYVYLGNVPGHPGENTYCSNCSKLLIERNGLDITDYQLKGNSCPNCRTTIPGYFALTHNPLP